MSAPEPATDERPDDGPDPPIRPWVFLFVFLGSPLLMALVILAVTFRHELAQNPLTIALIVGHLLSGAALLAFYLVVRRRRPGDR